MAAPAPSLSARRFLTRNLPSRYRVAWFAPHTSVLGGILMASANTENSSFSDLARQLQLQV
jgi:hypothetical protein